jgi:hypothetical protein
MPQSRRTEIIDFLVTQLKEIDGEVSGYNATYTYTQNLFNNVFRRVKFLDEVNDFPAIYVSAGTEIRDFNSKSLTVATLGVTIRAYVFGEDNSQSLVDDITQDIEHVIYSIGDHPDKGILDITIDSITSDEGLATPYGLAEVELTIVYRLDG